MEEFAANFFQSSPGPYFVPVLCSYKPTRPFFASIVCSLRPLGLRCLRALSPVSIVLLVLPFQQPAAVPNLQACPSGSYLFRPFCSSALPFLLVIYLPQCVSRHHFAFFRSAVVPMVLSPAPLICSLAPWLFPSFVSQFPVYYLGPPYFVWCMFNTRGFLSLNLIVFSPGPASPLFVQAVALFFPSLVPLLSRRRCVAFFSHSAPLLSCVRLLRFCLFGISEFFFSSFYDCLLLNIFFFQSIRFPCCLPPYKGYQVTLHLLLVWP